MNRRQTALDRTIGRLSRRLLGAMPQLVAVDSPRGTEAMYYTDHEIRGALACTEIEAMLLCDLMRLARPRQVLEIGAYVGWSTAHLVEGLGAVHGPRFALTVVDPFSEARTAAADVEARFWANLRAAFGHEIALPVRLVRGRSPEVLPLVAPPDGWEIAFVDGSHLDGQPLRDVRGLLPLMADGGVIVMHDGWMEHVRDALAWLAGQGWRVEPLATDAELAVCFAVEPAWWARFAPEYRAVRA